MCMCMCASLKTKRGCENLIIIIICEEGEEGG